jgi:hypothetical protein
VGETKGKKLMLLNRDWLTSAGCVTRFIGVAFEIDEMRERGLL